VSLVGHIRHVAVIIVGAVGDVLRASVGQEDGVRPLHVARPVRVLGRVEAGPRVAVLDPVAVGVRQRLVLHR
jgi:hypothetical protein